ncbi:hypothetical protein ACI3L1_14655 [Deinococcus sp. SM5_A1]|uniref:hypothetical protein n=1 Tax=Deinococcus sp. SM5_A1 TaxID=3379094 RepID=UPI00385AE919
MRKPTHLMALLISLPLLSGPALAWVPQLEETTAKNVIDGAYGRRAPIPTFLTMDLGVKDGQFVAGPQAVTAYMGGPACVDGWLAAPTDYSAGSRPAALTFSGQADQLFFQAQDARDSFKNLSVKDALGEEYTSKRLANGELRVDITVRGLPTEQARSAYLVRLRGKDGALLAPTRSTYVNDWKPIAGPAKATTGNADQTTNATSTSDGQITNTQVTSTVGNQTATTNSTTTSDGKTVTTNSTTTATKNPQKGPFEGTLVYYFEPLKAGLGAGEKVNLLIKTEADTECAYNVAVDLSKFQ